MLSVSERLDEKMGEVICLKWKTKTNEGSAEIKKSVWEKMTPDEKDLFYRLRDE